MCGSMDATTRRPSIAAITLALLMLFFGSLISAFGYVYLKEWQSEQAALIGCGVVWILAGPATVASGLWLLASLGRSRGALRIGGTAIIVSGTVLAAAAATGVVPCSGPA
jgi:hypothetical protein